MGMRISRFLAFALGFAGILPGDASAYVREVTSLGVPIAWSNPCVAMHIYLGSPPPLLTASDFLGASTQAAALWSYPQVACTDVRLNVLAEPEASAGVGNDRKNVIVLRQGSWCRDPSPVNDAGIPEPDCYSSSALAVTTIFKNKKTGEIVDADIEFNAVNYSWGDLVGQPLLTTSTTADFQYALTHELGHVIGLDHNCFTVNDGQARLNDNTGAPEVDCDTNPPPADTVLGATMYPSVSLPATPRRTLSPDDEQGACEIYPHVHDVCPGPATDGGCSVTTARVSARPWLEICYVGLAIFLSTLAFRPRREKV